LIAQFNAEEISNRSSSISNTRSTEAA